jgi:hypothetical protein
MCAALPRSIKRPFQKYKPKGKLDMKNVIITGSSNGFGYLAANSFARKGQPFKKTGSGFVSEKPLVFDYLERR